VRVSKGGHRQRPSFETPCFARLLRTRPEGLIPPVRSDRFQGIDPLGAWAPGRSAKRQVYRFTRSIMWHVATIDRPGLMLFWV